MPHLVPAQGLILRDPITGEILPPEGKHLPDSKYWRRRLAEGSVTIAEPPAPQPVKKSTKGETD